MLLNSNQFDRAPSLSTIRRWMKTNLQLSFKKVNIRFKQLLTSEDQVTKLKYLWVYLWLVRENYHIVYIDEFNVSDSTIKLYNWTIKGKSNYWFGNRKQNKLNWIIAISNEGPHNIHVHEESTTATAFALFVKETIKTLQSRGRTNLKIVLIFDNASVNVAKNVDEAIQKWKCLAVTLPPYTPEWNNSEMAINIIKRKIDGELKRNK